MAPSRYLLAVIDGGGTIPPALGLAAELIARGHPVRVLADPTVESSARAAGCAFTPWRRAPACASVAEQTAFVTDLESRNPIRQLQAVKEMLLIGPAAAFADDVLETVAEHPVDALLVEGGIPGILVGAEATGLPTAALMANVYFRPTPGMPLFGTGWSPARGPLGRARDALAPRAMARLWTGSLPHLNAVRAARDVPPVTDLFEMLDRCAAVLVLTSPSFDLPAPRLPANVRYVGPQLDDPDWAADGDWRPPGTGPLVLVATSSIFQDQVGALRRIAAGLGELPVRGVLTTGRAVAPEEVPAPANVRVLRAAPHRQVLAEASVVVTHAGHGSVLKALAAGVPLVCMPMGRDQRDNTVRVLRLGAGVRLGKDASPSRIAAVVRHVLDTPALVAAARRTAGVLAAEAATRPRAVDAAEALTGSG